VSRKYFRSIKNLQKL